MKGAANVPFLMDSMANNEIPFFGENCREDQTVFFSDEPIRQSADAVYDNSIGKFSKSRQLNPETQKQNVVYTCLEANKKNPLLFCGKVCDKICNLKDHIKTHRG